MAQPLIPTHRLVMVYPTSGLLHRAVKYCLPVPGGVPGAFSLIDRTGGSVLLSEAATGFADAFGFLIGKGGAVNITFEQLVTLTQWQVLDSFIQTPQQGPTLANNSLGQQTTAVLRDTAAHEVKVVCLEGAAAYVGHTNTNLGLGVNVQGFVDAHIGNISDDGAATGIYPYKWEVSRSAKYIAEFSAVVGVTLSTNRKVRRRRGLA